MDAASSLDLRAEADSGGDLYDRGLIGDALGLLDSSLDRVEVVIAVLDPLGVPPVRLEPLQNILGERDLGITIYVSTRS